MSETGSSLAQRQRTLIESRLSIFHKTVLENRWIPKTHVPTDKQATFLMLMGREAFYGGAGGGGKTEALLMAALQFAEVPGYTAILFRRTYRDLALPNAIMDRADQWLRGTGAKWNGADYVWTFPSGARLCFGYLVDERDKYRYQSAEFQFIGFDELTEFSESQYRFLFSRLRRLRGVETPLRMRGGSNPVSVGHDWVQARFVDPGSPDRPFKAGDIVQSRKTSHRRRRLVKRHHSECWERMFLE